MTPYELSILMDVFIGRAIREDRNAPIYMQTVLQLEQDGWIVPAPPNNGGLMSIRTPKLIAFVEHILALPAPVQEWRMPVQQVAP